MHLSLSITLALLCTINSFSPLSSALKLDIRTDLAGKASSKDLYGFMFEDINRSGDSGLYGQMLRNWNFQASDNGDPADLGFWNLVTSGNGAGKITLDTTNPLNAVNENSLRLDVTTSSEQSRVGASNEGWWGIRVQPKEAYTATFFAKASDGFTSPVTVSLESENGDVLASTTVTGLKTSYTKFSVQLSPSVQSTTTNNRFVVSVASSDAEGKSVWFHVFSLFGETYKGRANGLRKDIGEFLAAIKPSFFRFPGGNNLEGESIAQRWKWNETIGELEDRIGRMGDWGYWNTNGQGLLDYIYMCEDLNMKPILGIYAGYSLDHNSVPENELQPYIDEVLDELEYLTGDVSTAMGALRAKHGHPEPINLEYIEIGNEDWASSTYGYRYKAFYDAISKVYPNAKFIASTAVSTAKYDIIDDHYYQNTNEMLGRFSTYDNTPRDGPGVFIGEFATNVNGCCGHSPANMQAAFADAVFMTGCERNSDIVKMVAYAPLLVREGQSQWDPDLISFNTEKVWGSPSYYLHTIWSENRADAILQVDASDGGFGPLYWVIGEKQGSTNQILVKMVNTENSEQSVTFNVKGSGLLKNVGIAEAVSGTYGDSNSASNPSQVAVQRSLFNLSGNSTFTYTFKALSATVLILNTL